MGIANYFRVGKMEEGKMGQNIGEMGQNIGEMRLYVSKMGVP